MTKFTLISTAAALWFVGFSSQALASSQADICKKLFDEALWEEMVAPCTKAAESGDLPAQTMLGEAYDRAGNSAQTALWWGRASEAGYLQARNLLALKYYYGGSVFGPEEGWSQDYRKALDIWLPDAERGVATSQHMVGTMYFSGQGVERDPSEAWFWLMRAQQNGEKHSSDLLYELSKQLSPEARKRAMQRLDVLQ